LRVIVPGGYYSYDSAGKKIWLDYQYYGTNLENIEKIKNLTRNKILYDCKRSTVLPIVSNGCITHSYQGTEADTDKIQITLRTPITNSLTELTPVDGVVTLETDGKVLVLPTEDAAILPSFNQSVLNSDRLTIAESPFGGLKGSGSPDYAPGTLYTPTDGVYLTDLSGTNSTKTLTAGKLTELGLLTVDTSAHTITEEFIIRNDNEGADVTVIDPLTSGWTEGYSTGGTITYANGVITNTDSVCDANGKSVLIKSIGLGFLLGKAFIKFTIVSNTDASLCCLIVNPASSTYKQWSGVRFPLTGNVPTIFVLPISAPVSSTGANPSVLYERGGTFDLNYISRLYIGVEVSAGATVSYSVTDVKSCNGTWATIEAHVPDNLSATSLSLYTHNGTAYQLCSSHFLDGAYSQISQTSANCTFLDDTKFDDVYGTGLGRAVFPKGSAGATVNGSSGSITYSNNLGTDKRIGLKVDLPPSDNGRTNFNKVRAKLVINYAPDAENVYSATHIFADSTNTSYGLQNLTKPWIALYDPANSLIDFYLFTHRPQNLSFKRDETGTIYSLSLYPGAGSVYHGQIPFADLTLDTNSDTIPDCLEAAVNGSVTKFLENYTMVNPEDPDIARLLANDNYELMSNDNKYLYSEV